MNIYVLRIHTLNILSKVKKPPLGILSSIYCIKQVGKANVLHDRQETVMSIQSKRQTVYNLIRVEIVLKLLV